MTSLLDHSDVDSHFWLLADGNEYFEARSSGARIVLWMAFVRRAGRDGLTYLGVMRMGVLMTDAVY